MTKVRQATAHDALAISLPDERILTVDLAVHFTTRFLKVISYWHLTKNGSLTSTVSLLHLLLLVRARRKVGMVGSVSCPIGEWLYHFLIV